MVRSALWLVQVVGEGNTFTKNQLREAFPGVAQIDRRIRDLRDYRWVVHSNTQDASLLAEDQRFVAAGVAVWNPKARRASAQQKAVSAKERKAILARDGYMCTLCGIAGGEVYPDDALMSAVLAVSRLSVSGESGRKSEVFVTECKRCRSGGGSPPSPVSDAVDAAAGLDPNDLRRFYRWTESGRRGRTELDRAWSSFLRVPLDKRGEVMERLRRM